MADFNLLVPPQGVPPFIEVTTPPDPSTQQLWDVTAHKAFAFFWNETSPITGLTRDRARNLLRGGCELYDVASIASTGYMLSALAIGVERSWIDRSAAAARALTTLRFVSEQLPHHHGFFPHFVDIHTGRRVWKSEFSSIDTALLSVGALAAGQYFGGEIAQLAEALYAGIDWRWMQGRRGRAPTAVMLKMGWKPETGFSKFRWQHYDEASLLYLSALGGAPQNSLHGSLWDQWGQGEALLDGLACEQGEALLDGLACEQGKVLLDGLACEQGKVLLDGFACGQGEVLLEGFACGQGETLLEGFAIPGRPGPLFWAQMTPAYYSLQGLRDGSGRDWWKLWADTHRAHHAYCARNPQRYPPHREPLWGISACDRPPSRPGRPVRYRAQRPVDGANDGTIAPTAALASLTFLPEIADRTLHDLFTCYEGAAWGRYGFANAINPIQGWFDTDVIGIDLGMMLLAIENHRSGLIWRLTASHPATRKALTAAGFHNAG